MCLDGQTIPMNAEIELRPPDIVLSVEERVADGERLRLHYRFGDAGGWHGGEHRTGAFDRDERRLRSFRDHLDSVRSPLGSRDACRRMLGAMRHLTERLVPEPIQRALASAPPGAASLLVTSNADWVPFEALLVRRAGSAEEEAWSRVFDLTRWPSGREPARQLALDRRVWVVGQGRDLPAVDDEQARVHALSVGRSSTVARLDSLLETLDTGDLDVLHFAGHADVDVRRPDSWRIEIEPGRFLTDADLKGLGPGFARAAPLVFVNACSSALGGESWGRSAGIATSFVEAGARAVIGATWPITDALATEFAAAFYAALDRGRTLGSAARAAREAVRDLAPDDPTNLAYAVYGHPLASTRAAGDRTGLALDTDPGHRFGSVDARARPRLRVPAAATLAATLIGAIVFFGRGGEAPANDPPPDGGPPRTLAALPLDHDPTTNRALDDGSAREIRRQEADSPQPGASSTSAVDTESEEGSLDDASREIELTAGTTADLEMTPARLAVRFSEWGGAHLFTITVYRDGESAVEHRFFAQEDRWDVFAIDPPDPRWSGQVVAAEPAEQRIKVIIFEEPS